MPPARFPAAPSASARRLPSSPSRPVRTALRLTETPASCTTITSPSAAPIRLPDPDTSAYSLATPWGTTLRLPVNPSASSLINYLPTSTGIIAGAQPFTLGDYNRANKLPYSINFTLNIQWQPTNTMMIEIGYVGNLGRHQVIPLPFNQAHICALGNTDPACHGQQFSYGYTVVDPNSLLYPYGPMCVNDPSETTCPYGLMQQNYEGGNVDLRVPYIGYSSESESYTAAGIAAYHALQAHLEKRLSHGFQAGVSYTYSHATDEQSALGLFYNGNNPNNLRSGYGSADFDRKHVLNFTYGYTLPKFYSDSSLLGKLANSWTLNGTGIIQSGQPYSVIDYSGAVGSIFYSTFNGITNPIVPLNSRLHAQRPRLPEPSEPSTTESTGAGAALKSSCFTIPLIPQGTMGVPNGDDFETNFSTGQRNIFRQSYQKRTDASLAKNHRHP